MQELHSAALAAAEALINRALRHDPASRARLAGLSGKVIQLAIRQPHLDIYLCPRGDRLDLQGQCEEPVHCKVSGRAADMLSLLNRDNFSLAGSGVNVLGETRLLQQLQSLARDLEIDWEDALAGLIGDELAGPLAAGLRRAGRYGSAQLRQSRDALGPWLTDELQLTPSRPEFEAFSRQVNALALAADRLEARLQALLNPRKP